MNTMASCILFYLLNIVGVYLIIRWSFKYESMSEGDFSIFTIFMWVPLAQTVALIVLFFATLVMRHEYIKKNKIHTRRFREALFGVEKVNGKYQKKKECVK